MIATTRAAWHEPDTEDSTAASLGINGEAAERLLNNGLTHAEVAQIRVRGGAEISNAPAHTGQAR